MVYRATTPPLTADQRQLVSTNYRLANKAVELAFSKRHTLGIKLRDHYTKDELLSFAYDGLVIAARLFDGRCRFSSYAVSSMLGTIKSGIYADRFQVHREKTFNACQQVARKLEKSLGRPPTYEEIQQGVDYLNISIPTLKLLMRGHGTVILASHLQHENSDEQVDVTEGVDHQNPEQLLLSKDFSDRLWALVGQLTKRQRYVVEQIYLFDRSLISLAEELGISKQAVHSAKALALDRLAKFVREAGLDDAS